VQKLADSQLGVLIYSARPETFESVQGDELPVGVANERPDAVQGWGPVAVADP